MANLQYRFGDIPFVWVVKREYGTGVFFEEKNARKSYEDELKRLKSEKYELVHDEHSDMTYAVFKNGNGEYVQIWLDDQTISDYRS